ncbi:MAG: sporulation protein YqfD [Firmicutes bacterium]|nr:sporulation protein YqfD [Bacillota bacterium]
MIAFKAWRLVSGYVTIEIRGRVIERFVNLAMRNGVTLSNLRRGPESLVADVSARGFRILRRVARKTRCSIRIRKKHGLPFFLKRWRGRHAFIAGLLVCAVVIWLVSSRVWFIEVAGAGSDEAGREVLRAAAECGLKVGVPVSRLDSREIELGILSRVDHVSWVRLRFQGTRVIIDVIEKTLPPAPVDDPNTPANIVARVGGTVARVLVFMGEPAVKEGDSVVAGQVLIEGRLKGPPAPAPPTPPGAPPPPPKTIDRAVRARGQVMARVTRSVEVTEEYAQRVKERSGKTYTRGVIRIAGRDIIWKGRKPVPFAEHEKASRVTPLIWRNIPLPVERITETYYEIVPRRIELGREEARLSARDKALSAVRLELPQDADVVDVSAESHEGDSAVSVRVSITTLEDIGVSALMR